MSFYGQINNINKSTFQFDKIYSNRAEMDAGCSKDKVFIGRYVLVEYGQIPKLKAYEFIENGNISLYKNINSYLDSTNDEICEIKIIGQRIITQTGQTTTTSLSTYPSTNMRYVTGKVGENGTFTEASDTELKDIYQENALIDAETYSNYTRGWDSTVWQKVIKNNTEIYIMVAELNSSTPILEFIADAAPSQSDGLVDSVSTDGRYKIHIPSPWNIRLNNVEYNADGFNKNIKTYVEEPVNSISFGELEDTNEDGFKDTYPLNISLQSIGNAISNLWDIIYGFAGEPDENGKIIRNTSIFGSENEPQSIREIVEALNNLRDQTLDLNDQTSDLNDIAEDKIAEITEQIGIFDDKITEINNLINSSLVIDVENIDNLSDWDLEHIYHYNNKYYYLKINIDEENNEIREYGEIDNSVGSIWEIILDYQNSKEKWDNQIKTAIQEISGDIRDYIHIDDELDENSQDAIQNEPVAKAIHNLENIKANIDNPVFTGIPKIQTNELDENNQPVQKIVATQDYVDNKTFIVDNILDNTSENPVQNKVIYDALGNKINTNQALQNIVYNNNTESINFITDKSPRIQFIDGMNDLGEPNWTTQLLATENYVKNYINNYMNNYTAMINQLYDDLYYKGNGELLEINDVTPRNAYLTSNGTLIRMNIFVPKSLKNIEQIYIERITGGLINIGYLRFKYYNTQSNEISLSSKTSHQTTWSNFATDESVRFFNMGVSKVNDHMLRLYINIDDTGEGGNAGTNRKIFFTDSSGNYLNNVVLAFVPGFGGIRLRLGETIEDQQNTDNENIDDNDDNN